MHCSCCGLSWLDGIDPQLVRGEDTPRCVAFYQLDRAALGNLPGWFGRFRNFCVLPLTEIIYSGSHDSQLLGELPDVDVGVAALRLWLGIIQHIPDRLGSILVIVVLAPAPAQVALTLICDRAVHGRTVRLDVYIGWDAPVHLRRQIDLIVAQFMGLVVLHAPLGNRVVLACHARLYWLLRLPFLAYLGAGRSRLAGHLALPVCAFAVLLLAGFAS